MGQAAEATKPTAATATLDVERSVNEMSKALHEVDDHDALCGVDHLAESEASIDAAGGKDAGNRKLRDSSVQGLLTSRKEASRIRMFRFMLVGMLLMTAAVTAMAFFLLSREETNKFESAFDQFAGALADAAVEHQRTLVESMKTLANEVTAHAQANNMTWPYVVLPLFEASAMRYFAQCRGEFIGVNNMVMQEDRETYTNWVNLHFAEWVRDAHMIRYGNLDLLNMDPTNYHPYISQRTAEDTFPPDEIRTYYAVRTTQSPPMRKLGPVLNLNMNTIPGTAALTKSLLALKNETLITRIKPFNALPEEEHKNFHSDAGADNPHSFMHTPIYQKVNDPNSKIVGTVTSSVAWDASMQDLLPDNVEGIHCVVSNNCDQSFTYEIRGKGAYFLGHGDHHDHRFDALSVEVDLSLHTHPDFMFAPGHCVYSMRIYPTTDFQSGYNTNTPATFAAVVCSTFAFVALVFFAYDVFVQRRNMELVTTAARSHKVVSSLFPGEMKDHVLAQQSVRIPQQKNMLPRPSNILPSKRTSKSRLLKSTLRLSESQSRFAQSRFALPSNPLAKEYNNTTIFFGDLSGFTAWSASHTPEEVFELLETLYSSFDTIAKRRCVFKVETIGDCYVAATGLPEPQKNHASRIARFADDCMQRMKTLTAEMTVTLGPETSTLQLRVGLHSGKITGGVLRGDKSRFQLFGDTMNTASRMESNGVPGRIHVSRDTANELIRSGKENWLIPRQDKIVAKGKGEMDTFFVVIPPPGSPATSKTGLNDSFGDLGAEDGYSAASGPSAASLSPEHMA